MDIPSRPHTNLSGWGGRESDFDSDFEISMDERFLSDNPDEESVQAEAYDSSPEKNKKDVDEQSEVDPDTRRLIENGENVTYVLRAGVLRTRLRPKCSVNLHGARSSKDLLALCAVRLGWRINDNNTEQKKGSDYFWHDAITADSYMQRLCSLKSKSQRVRGFPMMAEFLKKAHTFNLINKLGTIFPGDYQDGFPQTWLIPQQLRDFKEVLDSNKTQTFIYKPSEGAQGDGISLFRKTSEFSALHTGKQLQENSVVQTYLSDPCLLEGYKFDLRLYVLVTSVDPVRAYVCREGLVRVCTEKYKKPTSSTLNKVYRHLTNYSLNKKNSNYLHTASSSTGREMSGSKRTVTAVFKEFASNGIDTDDIWASIDSLISRSLVALHLPLSEAYREVLGFKNMGDTCFQILGFDVLLDSDFNPWLLEINNNPSLSIDHEIETGDKVRSPVDEIVKTAVVCSAFEIVQHEKGALDELTPWTSALYDLILDPEADVVVDNETDALDLIHQVRSIFRHCMSVSRLKHTADPAKIRRLLRASKLLASRGLVVHDFDMLILKLRPSGRDINILNLFDLLLELSLHKAPKPHPTPYKALEMLLEDLLSLIMSDEEDEEV